MSAEPLVTASSPRRERQTHASAVLGRWLPLRHEATSDARLRLICFAHAGGGAWSFGGWAKLWPGVEVCAIELPGRGARYGEAPLVDQADLLARLTPRIARLHDRPFVLFGHSLGARIAYGLAAELQARGGAAPLGVIVSAGRPPGAAPHELTGRETDVALRVWLERMGGTPREVLENEELMRLTLPVLRADLALLSSGDRLAAPRLDCDLFAFGGDRDPMLPREGLMAWSRFTRRRFSCDLFEGGHFYLHDRPEPVAARLAALFDTMT